MLASVVDLKVQSSIYGLVAVLGRKEERHRKAYLTVTLDRLSLQGYLSTLALLEMRKAEVDESSLFDTSLVSQGIVVRGRISWASCMEPEQLKDESTWKFAVNGKQQQDMEVLCWL